MKKFLTVLCLSVFCFGFSEARTLVFSNEKAQTVDSGEFVIDVQDYENEIELKFGNNIDASVVFDRINNKFVINRAVDIDGDLAVNTDDLFVDTNNGRVGIGTDTPNKKLHVSGNAIVEENLMVLNSEIIHSTETYKDSFLDEELVWNVLQTHKTEDPNDKEFPTITSGNGWKEVLPITRWKVGDEGNNGQHYGYVGYLPEQNKEFRINTGGEDKTDLVLGVQAKDVIHISSTDKNVGILVDNPQEALHVGKNMRLDGAFLDKDGEVGLSGQVLSSTVTGTDWITNFSNTIPSIMSNSTLINPSTTTTLVLDGENFTPTTTVLIPGFDGTINSVNVLSSSQLELNITTGTTETMYDIVISNSGVLNTVWAGNGEDLLEVAVSTWVDLRAGGATFTDGNGAGNDIRYRSGMAMSRDANGMYFTGNNPWSSWVKFESLGWTRGQNKTLQWIFTGPTSAMMIGIGSDATDETNGSQYAHAEVQAYFNSATNFWGLYGNNGAVGSPTSQSSGATITSGAVYKLKFTNDGTAGSSQFTLYQLPSASPSDWDNESNVVTTFVVGGVSPDEANIMPFITPRTDGQRFIAVKVE